MKETYLCRKCGWEGPSSKLKLDGDAKRIWACPLCGYKPLKLKVKWK